MIEDIEDKVGLGRTWNYKPQHDETFENLSSRMSYLPFLGCVFPQEVHLGQDFRILRDILLSNFWICQSRKTWRALRTLHVVLHQCSGLNKLCIWIFQLVMSRGLKALTMGNSVR